jgi:hypothetical protein
MGIFILRVMEAETIYRLRASSLSPRSNDTITCKHALIGQKIYHHRPTEKK